MTTISILIPVLNRPHRPRSLVENIRQATRSEHRILFLCSLRDDHEIEACRETGADVFVADFPDQGQFARKINQGYKLTSDEFIQIGADDLVFHQNWDREVLKIARDSTAGVIGTNDLHNPRVKRGQSATHPLIKRSYIEEWGGTYDGTGVVFCELYDHQYVDEELVQTAIARRRWAFAKNSHVEHLHPYFGRQEMDSTYRKAFRHKDADYKLYQERLKDMRRCVPWERNRRARYKRDLSS